MIALETYIRDIKALQPIPTVVHQLLDIADKPGVSMEEIADVIQYDPVMTANILRTCNTAYFRVKEPVESIQDAASYLGIDQIVELALIKSGSQVLSGSCKGYGLESGGLWRYSVSSAVVARQIATRMGLETKNAIFTGSLLKDIGKVVLDPYVAAVGKDIHHLLEKDALSFLEAEKKILGIDHTELGALVAKTWNFTPRMIKMIRYHHLSDEKMIKNKNIAVIYLADCICMMLGKGVGSDGLSYRFKEEVMAHLGLGAKDLHLILSDIGNSMMEVETLMLAA